MNRTKTPRFIEITELDTGLRSCWDQDADVAQIQLTTETISHGKLVDDLGKIVEYDQEGRLASVQLLYCSEGITMQDVPPKAQERVKAGAEALGICVAHD